MQVSIVAIGSLCSLIVASAAPVASSSDFNTTLIQDKWRHFAVHSALPDAPSPKSKCALKCTTEAIGVYWACAAVCIKKQAPNSCILDGCPAAVAAFDVPCLKA